MTDPDAIELTHEQYHALLVEADSLIGEDPESGTPSGKRLLEIVDQIEVYERKHFPMSADPGA